VKRPRSADYPSTGAKDATPVLVPIAWRRAHGAADDVYRHLRCSALVRLTADLATQRLERGYLLRGDAGIAQQDYIGFGLDARNSQGFAVRRPGETAGVLRGEIGDAAHG
jgi:hypothetical protein